MKIYIANVTDRDAVIVILARNGYTVRQGKGRRNAADKDRCGYVELVGVGEESE